MNLGDTDTQSVTRTCKERGQGGDVRASAERCARTKLETEEQRAAIAPVFSQTELLALHCLPHHPMGFQEGGLSCWVEMAGSKSTRAMSQIGQCWSWTDSSRTGLELRR